jgi:hypothetical protein
MNWTMAGDLERWSDFLDARARLPQLVRKLIFATDDSITKRDFPAGEGIQRPGWDGILETTVGSEFVPHGISRWEMGVDRDPSSKASRDFNKRKGETPGVKQRESSFVFVTTRKWTNKSDWEDEKRGLGIWKDVRVYDSSNLEEWLETAPAVDVWFARTTGRRPKGVADIGEHWENLTALTNPPLRPCVFLTTRAENIEQLSKWMDGSASAISIESSSPKEVIDFVAAYLASLDDDEQSLREARIIVVESREAWQILSSSKNRLTLVQHPLMLIEPELVAQAVRQNHHVLLCVQRHQRHQGNRLELTRPFRHELEEALIESGVNRQTAARLSRSSGGSLPILKRQMSVLPSVIHPAWSHPIEASQVVPFVLAGGWDDSCVEDQMVLSQLAKRPYEDILNLANRWLTSEDSLLSRLGSGWSLVSHEDSLNLLFPFVNRKNIEAFVEVATEVLGLDDPALELPPSDRWSAVLYGKNPKYSRRLQSGLVETLALLGAKSESEESQVGSEAANAVDVVVRSIVPENSTWQRWATLSKFLPLLVEASPDVLLDRFEKDIIGANSQLLKLFEQEGDSPFASSPHTGLLWALENLAWEPAYLMRASLCLARLARLDPGGKLGNRPRKSLTEIFLCWLPHTKASSMQRLQVIDKLLKVEPDVAWALLLSIMPSSRGYVTSTHKPSYRNWVMNWSKGVTQAELTLQISAVADRLLANALSSPSRLVALIENCTLLPEPSLQSFLVQMKAIDQSTLTTESRRNVSNKLRDQTHKHRRFADAHWALPASIVDELEVIQSLFEPDDLSDRHGWLFVPWPHLPNEDHSWSHEQRESSLRNAQGKVVREIYEKEGIAGVIALAKVVEAPGSVGLILANTSLLQDATGLLPELLDSDDKSLVLFARGFAFGQFKSQDWIWIEGLNLSNWSEEQIVNLSTIIPFGPRAWSFIDTFGHSTTESYWSKIQPSPHDLTTHDLEAAANKLIQFRRPLQAVDLLSDAIHMKYAFDASLLFESLEAGLISLENKWETNEISSMLAYSLQQIFARLQSLEEIAQERLAMLEWNYIPIFDGHHASAKALHDWLAQNADFFAKVISLVYRSRHELVGEEKSPNEELQSRARNAMTLLDSWRYLPGCVGATVDEDVLRTWVVTARSHCSESGHIEVCDSRIGEILARSPDEFDGSWPCTAVRNVLEEVSSDEMLRGFKDAIFNQRGVVSKSLTEGGLQERELSASFLKDADSCIIGWPRVSAVLRKLSKDYENEGKSQDLERNARL